MKKQVLGILMGVMVTSSSVAGAASYVSSYGYNNSASYGNPPQNSYSYNQQQGNYGQQQNSYGQYQSNYNQQSNNITANVNVNFNGSGVDYEGGYVYATGTGILDYGGMIGSEDLAREAAIVDAQRYLVGAVDGAQIDSETTVEMKRLRNDTITRRISGIVRGAIIVDEGLSKSGQSYYVKMIMPLYGNNSVASAVMYDLPQRAPEPVPQVITPVIPPQEVHQYRQAGYTGLVVDAQGLGLQPCMSPVVFDTNGRAIYGVKNIDSNFAINKGMVSYVRSLAELQYSTGKEQRAGWNPLIIKAVGVRGGPNSVNNVNVVVTPEDGDRILLANQSGHFLENCAVVFAR